MAAEPESGEVRRLLHETAIDAASGPDMDAIRGRIRRRRSARRGATGLLAVALLGGGVAVASSDGKSTQVEVVDEPQTTVSSSSPTTEPSSPTTVHAPTTEPEPQPPAPGIPLDALETVTPEEIGRDLLVFGDAGIDRIVGGDRREVWDGPVERAFDDGAGGTIFQEAPGSAILRATDLSIPVDEVVLAEDGMQLVGFLRFVESERPAEPPHGRPEGHVWYLREDRHGSDEPTEWSFTLYRTHPGPGGEEQPIGDIGDSFANLDGIARVGEERTLFSTCHIQCAIRTALDDPDPIVLPHWLGGLDGSSERWAYVRFDVPDIEGNPTDPVLTLHDLADEVVSQVRLPDEIGWETFVDLSDDGAAALVWSRDWQTGEVTGPVLVDGIDTDEPRLRRVDSGGQQVRFSSG